MTDSRRAIFARVWFSMDAPAPVTLGEGQSAPASSSDSKKVDEHLVEFDAIQSISYQQVIGKEMGTVPYISGAIALHLHKVPELTRIVLSLVGSFGRIKFSFGHEGDPLAESSVYVCTLTRPRFHLTADGISATLEFHDAAYAKPYTAGSLAESRPLTQKIIDATNTATYFLAPDYSSESESTLVVDNPDALVATMRLENNQKYVRVPRTLLPQQVFKNICSAMGWSHRGVFQEGGKEIDTVEDTSHPLPLPPVAVAGNTVSDLYRWISGTLCRISKPDYAGTRPSDFVYRFYFTTDIRGNTVACFSTPDYSRRTGQRVDRFIGDIADADERDKARARQPTIPTLRYGFNIQDSPVIDCRVDDESLSSAVVAAGTYVSVDPSSGNPRQVVVTHDLDDSKRGHLAGAVVPAAGVVYSPERTAVGFEQSVAAGLSRYNSSIRMWLTLVGTQAYPAGSHFFFEYRLPSGENFPLVTGCMWLIISVAHEVSHQGYVTTLECVSMERPSSTFSPYVPAEATKPHDPPVIKQFGETFQPPATIVPGTYQYERAQAFFTINRRDQLMRDAMSGIPLDPVSQASVDNLNKRLTVTPPSEEEK